MLPPKRCSAITAEADCTKGSTESFPIAVSRAVCYSSIAALVHMLQVCLKLGHLQRTVCPPLAIGPPPGEMSLMPLLEVLRPDNLVALFAAVLLEQRVLLRVSAVEVLAQRQPICKPAAMPITAPSCCSWFQCCFRPGIEVQTPC